MNKFAINFNRKFSYLDEVGEIIINYKTGEDHSLDSFMDFIGKEHPNQRIVIDCKDGDDFVSTGRFYIIKGLKASGLENWVLRFDKITDESIEKIKEVGFPFFLNIGVAAWEDLYNFFDLGVTDVYIESQLGFCLDKVILVAREHNVKVRVRPNYASSMYFNEKSAYKFFIRPEDIEIYSPFVDIFEIYSTEDFPMLGIIGYKAYAIDKYWYGDLNEIIPTIGSKLDSKYLHPLFGERRTRCMKKCLYGHSCAMCSTLTELADSLEAAKMTVELKK